VDLASDIGRPGPSFDQAAFGDDLVVAHLVRRSQAARSPALPAEHRTHERPAVTNLYLLTGPGRSLLLDTGTVSHQEQVLHWLGDNLPDLGALDAVVLRMGEFDSVANMVAITDKFPVGTIHGAQADGLKWFDVHPEAAGPASLGEAAYARLASADRITLAPHRVVEVSQPLLRLLTTHWLHDPWTHSLFTSDAFSHAGPTTGSRPWIITDDTDATTVDDVCRHLLSGRFWWLAGADTAPIVDWLESFFASHRVDRICPTHGAVIEGADLVRCHVGLVTEALRRLADRPAGYPFAGAGICWRERSRR
jgi:flavorubredoxin